MLPNSPSDLRSLLRSAVYECSSRCLYESAEWAAELLVSIPSDSHSATPASSSSALQFHSGSAIDGSAPMPNPGASAFGLPRRVPEGSQFASHDTQHNTSVLECSTSHVLSGEPPLDTAVSATLGRSLFVAPRSQSRSAMLGVAAPIETVPWKTVEEQDEYLLAKCYFESKQYKRCAWILRESTSSKSLFLWALSTLQSGEKCRHERLGPILSPSDLMTLPNEELENILSRLCQVCGPLELISKLRDQWILYMFGLVLKLLKRNTLAIDCIISSLTLYPFNWSAWLILQDCVTKKQEFDSVRQRLPESIGKQFFSVNCSVERCFDLSTASAILTNLEYIFKDSSIVKSLRARVLYEEGSSSLSMAKLDMIFRCDPYRLDSIDFYSNLLYILEKPAELSLVAYRASLIDRNRPETCIAIGNMYASKNQHEKASEYFRQAISLNRSDSNAWLLLGHEYLELKGIEAATEAYRRAVDINPRSHSAWYALGNIYDLLDLYPIAAEHFMRALAIKPLSAQTWYSAALMFYKMESLEEAKYAAERACEVDASYVNPNNFALLGSISVSYSESASSHTPDITNSRKNQNSALNWYQMAWSLRTNASRKLEPEMYFNTATFLAQETASAFIRESGANGTVVSFEETETKINEFIDGAISNIELERAEALRELRHTLLLRVKEAVELKAKVNKRKRSSLATAAPLRLSPPDLRALANQSAIAGFDSRDMLESDMSHVIIVQNPQRRLSFDNILLADNTRSHETSNIDES